MVNFNGEIIEDDVLFLNQENRGLRYGDALFETIRLVNDEVLLWEEHYLRLMASMRIIRMEIPMEFTLEYLEEQIKKLAVQNKCNNQARVRLTIYRNSGGLYLPKTNIVSFVIETSPLESPYYILNTDKYEVELFKDFYINADMLSNLKTNNRILNVVGSVFAKENDYDNCLVINNSKNVVEGLNGNIFLVKGNVIKTPPLQDGCINGIIRNQLISVIKKIEGYTLEEASISTFELQKAEELFLTNCIQGIRPITNYRKKEYTTVVSQELIGKLNAVIRLQKRDLV
ncbi:branched-chain amino acid aminotransferase [Maribacter vaceletii]|uniref:branched-chain-amino-acid transaminase n=1 Tax=Maribacter vaceletii TaxID=1206816 RepID=A0A495E7B2_9FLAO|nr:aminotransferase class IV [Maribacter vaceletii]RKR12835.1 branched-chain amino acid aminotransferase [Maribacter vaceletii]